MTKVKIFINNLKFSISKREKFKFEPKGYLEMNEFDKDKAWELLNWTEWSKVQPRETLNTNVGSCSSGTLLQEEGSEKCYLALSKGWKEFDSFDEAFKWMRPRAKKHLLLDGDII